MTCHDAAHRAACVQTFDVTELMQHLEVVNFNGRMGFASLALLWPKGDDQVRSP